MEERREARRVRTHLPARCELASGIHIAVVLNGSPHGCFVQTQAAEPDDAPLRIEIRLPLGEWISLWGEVAYYLPTEGFGLQFIETPGGGDPMLERWIEHLSTLGDVQPALGLAEVTAAPPAAAIT